MSKELKKINLREPVETTASKAHKDNKISLKDIDFGFKNDSENEEGEYKDDEDEDEDEDDDIDVKKLKENELDELKQILEEENNTLEELHSVLSKTRKRVTSSILNSNNIIKHEIDDQNENKTNGIVFENLNTVVEYNEDDLKNSLTLDTMSEFCRNLGGTSDTKATIERQRQTADDDDDDEDEETKMEIERLKPKKSKKSHSHGNGKKNEDESSEEETEEGEKSKTKEMEVDDDDKDVNESGEGFDLLDEEPVIDRGLASCLKLAFNKGYIEQEKGKQNARFNKANIEAVNFTVEEKNYYDIDDKYNRNRDRFSGPLSDFQEKSNYKPNVKLDYIDEKGHAMNEKEAFRYLSHKFHGKGSGKKKTEKQNKKIKETEAMNKMSSIDTPLNTVALLVEKQKKLQQPFVVLSAAKNKQDQ
jgi:U4/U6.U5 tri-snRNP-associated protein 1